MKKELCLDANIITACLSPDEKQEQLVNLLREIVSHNILLWEPSHSHFEVFNALGRKTVSKLIQEEDLLEAIQIFSSLHTILVWNQELIENAWRIQKEGVQTFYDASYIALAQLKEVPLITEDKEMLKKGKKIYPAIFSLNEWLS